MRIVDTGGLDPEAAREVIGAGIHRQAMRAIDEADALVLVVDGRAGVSAIDHELAAQMRTTGKPLFLAVNKMDHQVVDHLVHDFHELGLGEAWPISAAHGRGIDSLLEAIADAVDAKDPEAQAKPDIMEALDLTEPGDEDDAEVKDKSRADAPRGPLRVAFVGRPNAGKSSLTNRLLGEERSLVHDVAGTTTDPVDTPFQIGGKEYILVDTAGIRRKAKIDEEVEKIAVTMALSQIERSHVAVLVIDSAIGPAEQDARIAGKIEEAGRALVIALNKSDLITGEARKKELRELSEENFHFLTWAPTVMLSAQRGDGVDRLFDLVNQVAEQHTRRIPTAQLNRFFAEVIEEMPPPVHRGREVRIHYITQGAVRPPTFIVWANQDGLSPSYKRFITNRLRETYGFRGTPIRIFLKVRKDRHDDPAYQK
jgi:GTP-binding protein